MKEFIELVQPVRVSMICDCGLGFMKPTGFVYDSFPSDYQHSCSHCGKMANFSKRYPHIEYQEKKGN